MNKLQMAHDWAMKHGKSSSIGDRENTVKYAWQYADAMQAEADKRIDKSLPDIFKKDKDGNCLHTHTTFSGGECFDCGVNLKEDFQPDWSQAPDDAVAWIYSNVDKSGFWCHKTPVRLSRGWCTSTMLNKAPTFNYKGDWQDSLRKRPE